MRLSDLEPGSQEELDWATHVLKTLYEIAAAEKGLKITEFTVTRKEPKNES